MDKLQEIKKKLEKVGGYDLIGIEDIDWLIENLEYNRNRKDELLMESGKQWTKLSRIKRILNEEEWKRGS